MAAAEPASEAARASADWGVLADPPKAKESGNHMRRVVCNRHAMRGGELDLSRDADRVDFLPSRSLTRRQPARIMRSHRPCLLFPALLAALSFGCGHRQDRTDVVARYDGNAITLAELQREVERLPAASRDYLRSPERRRRFVENLVVNDLLYAEGRRAGYDRDPEIERKVEELRKRLVIQRVMRRYRTPPDIPEAEIETYYRRHPLLFSSTRVRASHILVKSEAEAKQLADELRAHPERFAEFARKYSVDRATARKGGDLGTFGPGRMVPEFEEVAFALEPGEVSGPVKTRYGYHIIKVEKRWEGKRLPLDRVRRRIRTLLRTRAVQERTEKHLEDLKRKAHLKINDDVLARLDLSGPRPPRARAAGAKGRAPRLPARADR